MSFSLTKNSLSLLTSIITEICDDSDEDELLPLQALEDGLRSNDFQENPPSKRRKINCKHSNNFPVCSTSKYAILARFENESIVKFPFFNPELELCDTSLKPIDMCLCSVHIADCQYKLDVNTTAPVLSMLSNNDFKDHLCMKRTTIEIVYSIFNSGDVTLSPSQFLMVLWSLTTNASLKELSEKFETPIEDISNIQRAAYDIINRKRFEIEKWPQGKAAYATMSKFKTICGFPRVIAALASVHFPCDGHPYAGSFINQNREKTVIYELACDHRGSFIFSSYFWWPGKWPTSELHLESNLSSLPIPEGSYFLANGCYSQFERFVTPYFNLELSVNQVKFNKHHLMAMHVLHRSVLKMVSRFKNLRCLKTQSHWLLRKQFQACLLLHNVCLEMEDDVVVDPKLSKETFFPEPLFYPSTDADSLRDMIASQCTNDS